MDHPLFRKRERGLQIFVPLLRGGAWIVWRQGCVKREKTHPYPSQEGNRTRPTLFIHPLSAKGEEEGRARRAEGVSPPGIPNFFTKKLNYYDTIAVKPTYL